MVSRQTVNGNAQSHWYGFIPFPPPFMPLISNASSHLLRWRPLHGSLLYNHQSFQTHPSRSPTRHLLHSINKHPMLKPVTQKDAGEPDPTLGKGGAASTSALAGPVKGGRWVKLYLWPLREESTSPLADREPGEASLESAPRTPSGPSQRRLGPSLSRESGWLEQQGDQASWM